MTNERLKEIKDSIDFQLLLSKQLHTDDELILEEKELYDYIIELQTTVNNCKGRIDKAIELLEKYGNGTFDKNLLNILCGDEK